VKTFIIKQSLIGKNRKMNYLLHSIENPNSIKEEDALKIQNELERNPFSSLLRILYTKYLKNQKLNYYQDLAKTAIYVSDRIRLKKIFFDKKKKIKSKKIKKIKNEKMTFDEWIMFVDSKSKKIEDSNEINIDFATENLAKIYTKQQKYDLAIATYRKLMLKFPKKSTLFANQIKKIKQR